MQNKGVLTIFPLVRGGGLKKYHSLSKWKFNLHAFLWDQPISFMAKMGEGGWNLLSLKGGPKTLMMYFGFASSPLNQSLRTVPYDKDEQIDEVKVTLKIKSIYNILT